MNQEAMSLTPHVIEEIRRTVAQSVTECVNLFRDDRSEALNKSEQALQIIGSHIRLCEKLEEIAEQDRARQELKIDNVADTVSKLSDKLDATALMLDNKITAKVSGIWKVINGVSFATIILLISIIGVLIYPTFIHHSGG